MGKRIKGNQPHQNEQPMKIGSATMVREPSITFLIFRIVVVCTAWKRDCR